MLSLLNLVSVFCVLLGLKRLSVFYSPCFVAIIAGSKKDWVTSSCQILKDTVCIENLQRFSTLVYCKEKRPALGIMRGCIYLSFWTVSSTGGQEQLVQMSWICGCHLDMGTPALGTKLAFFFWTLRSRSLQVSLGYSRVCARRWLPQVYFVVQLLWPSGDLPQSMRMSWALVTFGDSVTVYDSKTSGGQGDLLLRALQVSY